MGEEDVVTPLDDFLARHEEASIGVALFIADSTVLGPLYEWPSCDWLWDPVHQVFAWWWMGEDPGGHAVHVSQIEALDYGVRLYMATGIVELTGVYDPEQQRQLATWRKQRDAELIMRGLRMTVLAAAQDQPLPDAPLQEYPVMVEWQPVMEEPETWVPVGAFALDADRVVFYALPRHNALAAEYERLVASDMPPAILWDYIWRQANDYTVARGVVPPERARSAYAAAIQAAHKAEPFSTAATAV